jgi:hypothetical protein
MAMGQKDRPWRARITFQNGEATATIAPGTAVVVLNTKPSAVVSAKTAGAVQTAALFAGIAGDSAIPGEYFDVVVGGYAPLVTVGVLTRVATTDVWPSFQSFSPGDYFVIDTTNNGFSRAGAAAGTAPFGYQVVAMNSFAGATTTQAATLGSGTSSAVTMGCWIRGLI